MRTRVPVYALQARLGAKKAMGSARARRSLGSAALLELGFHLALLELDNVGENKLERVHRLFEAEDDRGRAKLAKVKLDGPAVDDADNAELLVRVGEELALALLRLEEEEAKQANQGDNKGDDEGVLCRRMLALLS